MTCGLICGQVQNMIPADCGQFRGDRLAKLLNFKKMILNARRTSYWIHEVAGSIPSRQTKTQHPWVVIVVKIEISQHYISERKKTLLLYVTPVCLRNLTYKLARLQNICHIISHTMHHGGNYEYHVDALIFGNVNHSKTTVLFLNFSLQKKFQWFWHACVWMSVLRLQVSFHI